MEQTVQKITYGMNIEQAVTALGNQLDARACGIPARFSFHWAGYRFRGTLTSLDRSKGEIEVTARLGVLPFTAENAALRQKGMDVLNRCENLNNVRFRVTSSGEILCAASTIFESKISAVPVAQALTVTLLNLRKHLKHFDGLLIPVS